MSEFIYVLENPSMPGLVKIGRTERSVAERAGELSASTGVPTEFVVAREYAVPDAVAAEAVIHRRLAEYRVCENREFFRIESDEAAQIIESLLEVAKRDFRRDFEQEDSLAESAAPVAIRLGTVRPRVLEEQLGIPYEWAQGAISALRLRGS